MFVEISCLKKCTVVVLLITSLLTIRCLSATTARRDSITLNESISDGQNLVSSNNSFVLGFFSPGASSNRYIGIWYNTVPNGTVVWVANRNNPVQDNETVAPPRVSSMVGYSDNLVAAALEYIAKNGLPCPAPEAPARADAATGKKAPQAKGSIDLDQALTYLHRGCSLTSLAVKHIDLAVAVLSSFLDPEKVASLSKFTDKRAYISEDGPYPSDE